MDVLVSQLAAATDPSIVLGNLVDRVQWASDASIYRLIPRVVVMPRTAEDVQAVMAVAAKNNVPITFRAGGTSLSGQAVTDGILVVVSKSMRAIRVLDNGNAVACQPGAVGSWVNAALARFSRKIGPDPASIQAAEIGGIVANNASGMCCGIAANSYRTVTGLDLILADGWRIDTDDPNANNRLQADRPEIARGLMQLRDDIYANAALRDRIAAAFSVKNTIGYSLNAFLDANTPVDILQRLIVGSEGTLAFIAEATFRTLPLPRFRATAWLLFRSVEDAGRAVAPLADAQAAAIEVLDSIALERVAGKLPDPIPSGEPAALLVEFQEASEDVLAYRLAAAGPILAKFDLAAPAAFTRDADLQARYWSIRKGLFPSVGAIRAAGTAVVIEDITFPVARLAEGIRALRGSFNKHGYTDAVIFGHAKDGNLHFTITPDFSKSGEVTRYDRFMRELVDLVLSFGGNIKAEHGTGRNMAPFVEKQWGADAVAIMWRIKRLFDPKNLLNPGVLMSADSDCHIKNLKTLPPVDPLVDRCIECGFCEPVCPSRDYTMSPRQRIAALRALSSGSDEQRAAVRADWQHRVVDSCAADGMCETACPVSINTGDLVKAERARRRSGIQRWMASLSQRHFALLAGGMRRGLAVARLVGGKLPGRAIRLPRPAPPLPREFPAAEPGAPTVVYFPTCLARTFGNDPLPELLAELCRAAGIGLVIPDNASSLCCGQPWSSKGFPDAYREMAQRSAQAILAATETGGVHVVTDTSTCASQFTHFSQSLEAGTAAAWKKLVIHDPAEFTATFLIPRLQAKNLLKKSIPALAVHPTCSEQQHGWTAHLAESARAISYSTTVPTAIGCCGMAGDKGWTLPDLPKAGSAREGAEARDANCSGGVATSATCGLALSQASGITYRHLWHWLREAISG
jgi:D-lactate dehydrogenase